jgi:hypothetical protein
LKNVLSRRDRNISRKGMTSPGSDNLAIWIESRNFPKVSDKSLYKIERAFSGTARRPKAGRKGRLFRTN